MDDSVFGYKIRKPFSGEDAFFAKNAHVGGMAGEDGQIVLNPYSKLKPEELQSVAKNEAIRLHLRDKKTPLSFGVTEKQKSSFAGTDYGKPENENFLRQTLLARILTGDPSAMDVTQEQRTAAKALQQELDSRHYNDFVQGLFKIPNNKFRIP